jgi:Pyruvate/2-oxoacid:ferredoxin oxidoreductase delta subunit
MGFVTFVEGPLLKIVFLAFFIGLIIRVFSFVFSIIKGNNSSGSKIRYFSAIFARFLIPFHMSAFKRPVYSMLRYAFHICLFVVPIWLGGHIYLLEESSLGWSWTPLPDEWLDIMTLLLIGLAVFFVIRHLTIKDVRMQSSFSDYIIITIAALPFVTGYFLKNGTLDDISFFSENMWTIHILSGEIMIIATVFLFCRTRMDVSKCTGCASCVLSCPTSTLESEDRGNLRIFNYSHYQCICCGSCVNTCPENAVELRHEMSVKRFFQVLAKQEIRSVELESCDRCGALFTPEPLMQKINMVFTEEYLRLCPDCRKITRGEYIKSISPWHRKSRQSAQL